MRKNRIKRLPVTADKIGDVISNGKIIGIVTKTRQSNIKSNKTTDVMAVYR
jgi:hypothetical protein